MAYKQAKISNKCVQSFCPSSVHVNKGTLFTIFLLADIRDDNKHLAFEVTRKVAFITSNKKQKNKNGQWPLWASVLSSMEIESLSREYIFSIRNSHHSFSILDDFCSVFGKRFKLSLRYKY